MEIIYHTTFSDNVVSNATASTAVETAGILFTMMVIHSTITSVGIITNFTVIVVFLNHKILREKIPNIFIINQVSSLFSWIKLKIHETKIFFTIGMCRPEIIPLMFVFLSVLALRVEPPLREISFLVTETS